MKATQGCIKLGHGLIADGMDSFGSGGKREQNQDNRALQVCLERVDTYWEAGEWCPEDLSVTCIYAYRSHVMTCEASDGYVVTGDWTPRP